MVTYQIIITKNLISIITLTSGPPLVPSTHFYWKVTHIKCPVVAELSSTMGSSPFKLLHIKISFNYPFIPITSFRVNSGQWSKSKSTSWLKSTFRVDLTRRVDPFNSSSSINHETLKSRSNSSSSFSNSLSSSYQQNRDFPN